MTTQLTIFDLDHTLFIKNASVAFGAYLYEQKEITFYKIVKLVFPYMLHKCHLLSLERLHGTIFHDLFWNKKASYFNNHAQKFLDLYMDQLLDKTLLNKLQEAQKGHTALFSSSPNFLVELIAKRLNIPYWMGSGYSVDDSGLFCSISYIVEGHAKAKKTQELSDALQIPKASITALSDSYLDIPLLEVVGNPIAVNPDRRLLKECKKRNWTILSTF